MRVAATLQAGGDHAYRSRSVPRTMRGYGRGVPEVHLEPMSDEEYAEFRERSEVSYAAQIAASRAVSLPEARRHAAEDHERLLPEGVRTPDHYLWTAYEGGEPVGHLWLHVETKPDGRDAFGYGIEVRPELRRRGYGRAITAAAEQKCGEMNVVSIGLTVFGPTRRLKVCMRTWPLRSPCFRCAST
jgi:GNAT superfamily N-acetyltransferase